MLTYIGDNIAYRHGNSFISYLDDCSRKVESKWSGRKRTVDVLDVLEEWIVTNGRPEKVMRDNGKQFISKTFRHFLKRNNIDDKPIAVVVVIQQKRCLNVFLEAAEIFTEYERIDQSPYLVLAGSFQYSYLLLPTLCFWYNSYLNS